MELCRPLGCFETQLAMEACTIILPCHLKLARPVDTVLLKAAVEHVVLMNPNLRAGVVQEDDGRFWFVPIEKIEDVFEVLPSSTNWVEVCEKFQRFSLRQDPSLACLFKVFFIAETSTSARMIAVYHHVIADGTSGMTLTHEILKDYTSLTLGIPLAHCPSIAPASPDAMARAHLGDRYEHFRRKWLNEEIRNRRSFNCHMPVDFAEPPANLALYFTSSSEQYKGFVTACKKHCVTVGSAIIASLLFGHVRTLISLENCVLEDYTVGCGVPANLRGRLDLGLPKNAVGFLATNMMITMRLSRNTSFWSLAAEVNKEISRKLSPEHRHYCFDYYAAEEILEDPVIGKRMEANGMIYQNITCSNMGCYPGPVSYGDLRIESLHCSGGVWGPQLSDNLQLLVFSTDKFNISMVHNAGYEDIRRAESIFNSVKYFARSLKDAQEDLSLANFMEAVCV